MKTQKHTTQPQQENQNGVIQQLISVYAQVAGVDPKAISAALSKMNPNQQKSALQKMQQAIQQKTQQQPQEAQQAPQQQMQQPPQQQEEGQEQPQMKSGGIHINPANKGKFNATKKATGETTEELTHSSNPLTRKRAIFAQNAAKWHHQEGGEVNPEFIEQFKAGGTYATSGIPTNGSIKVWGNHNISPASYNNNRFNPDSDDDKLNPQTDKINASVGPIEPQEATIEAEKGEKIVKSQLAGIWEINGSKHTQGGTPLNPEPGSFIFSNDPKLAITKDEKKLFEFKEGGSTAKSKNTPSKILGREVDLKEYNRYMSILQNPKAETIEKATAALMVDKYQKKMGQVAYLQEEKKNQQAPPFSESTLPLTNPTIEKQVNQQDMYKMGGYYDLGDEVPCPCGGIPPNCTPCTQAQLEALSQSAPRTTRDKVTSDYKSIYKAPTGELFNKEGLYSKGQVPNAIPGGKPNGQWQDAIINMIYSGATPEQLIAKKHITPQGWQKVFKPYFDSVGKTTFGLNTPDRQLFVPNQPIPGYAPTPDKPLPPPITTPPASYDENPPNGTAQVQVPPIEATSTLPYDIKGYLTPAQKADLTYKGLQAMNVKKYMPMREQIHLNDVSLDKVNLQPFLNNINNQNFQAYNSLNVADPRNAKLMASNIYGKGADNIQQAIGQVENTNIQIGNQENLTNLQQHNQEEMFNVPATGRYYDQTVMANQNFDDEKRYARNQVASTLNEYQSQDDQLAWALAAQNKYGLRKVVDPKTGQTYNQPVPLYSYNPKGGITYNKDVADISMASGYTRENSMTQYYDALEKLTQMGFDKKSAAYIIANMMKSKQPIYNTNPAIQ